MQIVPLQPLPAQAVGVLLSDQQVNLTLRQLSSGLFISVAIENLEIVGLVICQNMNRIVRDAYLGLIGDFVFYDTTGARANPFFSGLGTRFQLVYVDAADLAELEP